MMMKMMLMAATVKNDGRGNVILNKERREVMDNYEFIQKGWECPKCHNVMAPDQKWCIFCAADKTTDVTSISPIQWALKNCSYINTNLPFDKKDTE